MTAAVGSPSAGATAAAAAIRVRDAEDDDMAAVAAIYAHHVRFGLGSFEETPPDLDQITRRRRAVLARGLPYLVACGPDRAVSGFAFTRPTAPGRPIVTRSRTRSTWPRRRRGAGSAGRCCRR